MMSGLNLRGLWPAGERTIDALAVVFMFTTAVLLLHPFQDTPFIDDWVYAWPVENFLKTGDLEILTYSGAINLPQVLWGSLFALPAGFSFTALRVSTFVLAISSLCGLYLLLRELHAPRATALLALTVLGVYPIFFILSFSFMTDVPFVACMIAASLALVLALRQQSTVWLALAAVFIALSISMRFVGVALGAAFGMVLLFHAGDWGRRRIWLVLLPPAFTILLIVWRQSHMVSPETTTWLGPAARFASFGYALGLLPKMTVATLAFLSHAVGLALLPLAIALSSRAVVLRAAPIFAVLVGVFVLAYHTNIDYPLPLIEGSTWSLDELGRTMGLVPGFDPLDVPGWIYWTFGVLGWMSMSVVLASLMQRPRSVEWFFIWSIIFGIAVIAVLWLLHDRYALPVIVPLLILSATKVKSSRLVWAVPAILIFAIASTIQTRDHLNYNAALFSSLEYLRAKGAHDSDINAGYAIGGWNQYAHGENAPRDEFGAAQIPWLNASRTTKLRYEISNSPPTDAKVLTTIPYNRWFGRSGSLYIIERVSPSALDDLSVR